MLTESGDRSIEVHPVPEDDGRYHQIQAAENCLDQTSMAISAWIFASDLFTVIPYPLTSVRAAGITLGLEIGKLKAGLTSLQINCCTDIREIAGGPPMDCYKDFSPSRETLFAIENVRFLPSFLAAALIRYLFSNWRSIMPLKSFSGLLCISYRRFHPPQQ